MSRNNSSRPDPLRPSESLADWDAQGWSAESVSFEVAPKLATTLSIRFDPKDANRLRQAARLKGMTQSEFVRWSTIRAATHCLDTTPSVTLTVDQPEAGRSTAAISSSQHEAGFSVEHVSGNLLVGTGDDPS